MQLTLPNADPRGSERNAASLDRPKVQVYKRLARRGNLAKTHCRPVLVKSNDGRHRNHTLHWEKMFALKQTTG